MATVTTPGAAAWLHSFETLGGGSVRNSQNEHCFGWIAYGKTDDERELRRMFNALDGDERLAGAVEALILQRETVRHEAASGAEPMTIASVKPA